MPLSRTDVQRVHDEIAVTVAKAKRKGGILNSKQEAARITREHPNCGMTAAQIRDRLFELAVQKPVAVDTSD